LCVKVAVTVVSPVNWRVQLPVPEQPPPIQPAKVEPTAGTAVRSTGMVESKAATQVVPQLIPEGVLVTVPLPVPARVTVSVKISSGKMTPRFLVDSEERVISGEKAIAVDTLLKIRAIARKRAVDMR
jgi:hypothetical protein